jgi:hypothetical protein
MNLLAPLRIWRIRWDLAALQGLNKDQGFHVSIERHQPVRFGPATTRTYWQYVNSIDTPRGRVRLIVGCVETMVDGQGNAKLWEVMDIAKEQAVIVLNPNGRNQ